jgi:N-acetylglucosaminyldiphosphoundecaprenol N-acetyl-beta-D-mannosaminyltransferase
MFGCEIDALTLEETVSEIDRLITRRQSPVQHCVVNAGKVVMMADDERLRRIVAGCELVNADGQAVVWAARLLGKCLPERVAGIDLFQALLSFAAQSDRSVYFLGARREVVVKVVSRAKAEYPTLRIAGHRDGYFSMSDEGVADEIRDAAPDILFVAMPSPRKEYWLAEYLDRMDLPFAMGVGGSFDVYAGLVRRAPSWMQAWGIEWVFRLIQEPRRMWKRYVFGNARFAALLARELVRTNFR